MDIKSVIMLICILSACGNYNKDHGSNDQITFIIRNLNDKALQDVYVKSDNWNSDTINVDANSDGVLYRDMTPGEFHEGYSVVFGKSNNDYGYGDYTSRIPTSESFLVSFHGDTVRFTAFHVE